MKRIISLGLMMTLLATILCACGTKVMDVTIEGGAESATLAIEKYYTAMSSLDFDTLLEVSAFSTKLAYKTRLLNMMTKSITQELKQ